MEQKVSQEEFVIRAIEKLRKPPYKGIHTVYSGFNQAFRKYFDADPIAVTSKMAQDGKIVIRPVKGGVMLYLPEETPERPDPDKVLKDILS
jgi:hypothetical protein